MKTGTTNLPLHGGKCPNWLFPKMKKLAGAITETIIHEYDEKELLERLSNPHWFQSLGCALGFDWHSSGLTTTTCGALKEALQEKNLGVQIAGGKGKTSTKTPNEIENTQLPNKQIQKLKKASKTIAKVDNTLVQDQYQLYHHTIIFTRKGEFTVVQQGMNNSSNGYARRYHWLEDDIKDFIEEPHTAICCDQKNKTLDLTAEQSEETRKTSLDLIKDEPEKIFNAFKTRTTLKDFTQDREELHMPSNHWIRRNDLSKKDKEILKKAYEIQPRNYEELITLQGMGSKKIRALTLVSDLIYNTEPSKRDPKTYSFAHGGKDGTPYPVNDETYQNTIETLNKSIKDAKNIEKKEKQKAIKRLHKHIKNKE